MSGPAANFGIGTRGRGSAIMQYDRNRRRLLSALTLASFADIWRASPAAAQPGAGLPPIPSRPSGQRLPSWRGRARCVTKPSARATRPTGRWWCVTASSWEKAGTTSCCTPPTPNYWRCATPRAGSGPATFRNARSIPPRRRAPCARALSTGRVCGGCSPRACWSRGSSQGSDVECLMSPADPPKPARCLLPGAARGMADARRARRTHGGQRARGGPLSINTCGDSGPARRCLARRKAQNEGRYDQSNNHEKRQHSPSAGNPICSPRFSRRTRKLRWSCSETGPASRRAGA